MQIFFLDDMKDRTKRFKSFVPSAKCVETAQEMIDLLKSTDEPVDYLLLDHDLGNRIFVDSSDLNTGMEVVRWMERNRDSLPEIKSVIVHTHNPDGAQNMIHALREMDIKATYCGFANLNLEGFSKEIYSEEGTS